MDDNILYLPSTVFLETQKSFLCFFGLFLSSFLPETFWVPSINRRVSEDCVWYIRYTSESVIRLFVFKNFLTRSIIQYPLYSCTFLLVQLVIVVLRYAALHMVSLWGNGSTPIAFTKGPLAPQCRPDWNEGTVLVNQCVTRRAPRLVLVFVKLGYLASSS